MFIRKIEMLRQKLETIVRKDGLTGILSREAFLEDLKHELDAIPDDANLQEALLIVDADYFKRINDTHGHVAGDRALIAITNALRKGVRSTDSIGRLGGEEFAIHLHNVTEERAQEVAERIRQLVVDASPEVDIPDLKLTVSIGAVSFKRKKEVVDLLIAADKMLYRAKDKGRDRVEFSKMESFALGK
ncbi:MAG: GGDEF domain-containing protein [Rhizobiaceae bacterium]|nr:GGDEF domain-containing protein [Rhizobiaceae bacterium]